jgi:hypothetical protein
MKIKASSRVNVFFNAKWTIFSRVTSIILRVMPLDNVKKLKMFFLSTLAKISLQQYIHAIYEEYLSHVLI